MKLAAARPFVMVPESQLAEGGINISDCCRVGVLGWLSEPEEPLCWSQTEHEAYRFFWRSSFDGNAVVHNHLQSFEPDVLKLRPPGRRVRVGRGASIQKARVTTSGPCP
jgi:hypothetical protein